MAAAAILATLAVACGAEDERRVQVAAAANLRPAFEEMSPQLEAACECSVTSVFGSSGLLHEQVLAGAGFAVFFSADEAFVESLAEEGAVLPNTVTAYAVGPLALVWRDGIEPVRTLADLGRPDVRRVSIANPAHAPYGRAAQAAMERVDVWGEVQPRVVYGENVRQATDYVLSGDADAGVVALAMVIGTDRDFEVVPAELHAPVVQAAAVVAGVDETAGRAILDHVMSEAGQQVLGRYGFEAAP